jgi:hypothetical protein
MVKRLCVGAVACVVLSLIAALLANSDWDCGTGDGKMLDGGGAWSFTVCKSGSHVISHLSEAYPNAAWANRVFEERVRDAITVIEQNEKVDDDGRTIGKRAVGTFADPGFSKPVNSIFWVDDQYIKSINSTSRDLALYVERSEN